MNSTRQTQVVVLEPGAEQFSLAPGERVELAYSHDAEATWDLTIELQDDSFIVFHAMAVVEVWKDGRLVLRCP